MILQLCFVFISFLFDISSSAYCGNHEVDHPDAAHFTYEDPSKWNTDYVPACDGSSQSPINIITKATENKKYGKPFVVSGYNTDIKHESFVNNGHTIQITTDPNIEVTGGPAGGDSFKLAQFHFHFGRNQSEGSEHTIDGKKFPMELHLVHLNKKYASVNEAVTKPDGLLVIGVLVNSNEKGLDILQKFAKNLNKVVGSETDATVDSTIRLSNLLPDNGKVTNYFTYNGSLTTPKCQEAVIWVVATNQITISNKDLKEFRKLKNSCGGLIAGNFRPVQPLNSRPVYSVTN